MAFSLRSFSLVRFVFFSVSSVMCAVAPAQGGEGAWTASGPPGTVTAISPGKNGHTYAITSSGLYQSVDAGESWARVGPAPLCSPGSTLILDDVYEDLLYSAGNGVCRTKFGGFEWIQAGGLPQTASGVRAVADGWGVVFALGRDLGLSWSFDFGLTFEALSIPFQEPLSLAVDPNSRAHIYVGTAAGQIFRSLNTGRSWTPIGKGLPAAPILDLAAVQLGPCPPSCAQFPILYAAVAGNGLYRSVDGGETWAASSAGLPAGDVLSLTVDPMFANVLYTGSNAGVFRSVDGGRTWLPLSSGLPQTGVRQVQTDSTGRFLIAVPAAGEGTFTYRLPDPTLTASGPSGTLLANTAATIALKLDFPQPEPIRLIVSSSDQSVVSTQNQSGYSFTPLTDSAVVSVWPVGAGTATVTVTLPALFGGASASVSTNVINPPPPEIGGTGPPNATAATRPFVLRIDFKDAYNIQNVVPTTRLYWNGAAPRETRLKGFCAMPCFYWLEADVTAADLAAGGTAQLTLVNPPAGGGTSAAFPFLVRSPDRAPLARGGRRPPPRVTNPRG